MRLTRRLAALSSLAAVAGLAVPRGLRAQEGWYPLKDAAGRPIQNFRLPIELQTEIMALENAVTFGARLADVTIIEVFDSNCPYCRVAARDVTQMMARDRELAVTIINAPSLGLPSVLAARVEYAVKVLGGVDKARAFHEASMRARGLFDGLRALDLAADLGLDRKAVEDLADRPESGRVVAQAVRLANASNLAATPSWLIAGTAVIGWPGRPTMEAIVGSIRDCDKPVCT
ncbi:MAG: thioredoxin domain-containing protein [Phreatobacter sp.]|jgi:protein-disulfide isomerase|nr:thioredoxin domain-containing protein [Phreatobacter sp.]